MRLKAICLLVLIVVIASSALAQYKDSDRSLIGLQVSVFNPSGSELGDIGKSWVGPTVDFNVLYDQYDRPTGIISVGLFSDDASGVSASFTPITATYIKRFGKDVNNTWYVGGGLGAYLCKFEQFAGFLGNVEDKETKYGVHLTAGYEFGKFYFANFSYDVVDDLSTQFGQNIDFSGWTISVGTHYTF